MRRFVAAICLVLAITGATWCVDGCEETSARKTSEAPAAAACTFCVVPFAVGVEFDLVPDKALVAVPDTVPTLRLVSTPPLSIDHPPRLV